MHVYLLIHCAQKQIYSVLLNFQILRFQQGEAGSFLVAFSHCFHVAMDISSFLPTVGE